MGVNSLPKTVTRHRDRDLNPGPSAPESSTQTTRLPSHPQNDMKGLILEGDRMPSDIASVRTRTHRQTNRSQTVLGRRTHKKHDNGHTK